MSEEPIYTGEVVVTAISGNLTRTKFAGRTGWRFHSDLCSALYHTPGKLLQGLRAGLLAMKLVESKPDVKPAQPEARRSPEQPGIPTPPSK